MHYKELKLNNVWRTCNKIRAAIFRVGINLWEHYLPLDPNRNCLISESKFISVLAGPLRDVIGLSEEEICELADYFRVQDGRILYTQLCEIIHDSVYLLIHRIQMASTVCPKKFKLLPHTDHRWQLS